MEDAARPPRKGSGGRENSNVKGGSSELVRRRCASQETRPTSTRHISRYRSHHLSVHTPFQRLSVHTTSAFARVPEGGAPDSSLSFNPFHLHLTSPRPHTHPSFTSPRLHLTSPSPNPPSHPPTVTQPAFTHTLNHPHPPSPNPFFTQYRIRTTPPSLNLAFTQPLLYSTPHSHPPAFT